MITAQEATGEGVDREEVVEEDEGEGEEQAESEMSKNSRKGVVKATRQLLSNG